MLSNRTEIESLNGRKGQTDGFMKRQIKSTKIRARLRVAGAKKSFYSY